MFVKKVLYVSGLVVLCALSLFVIAYVMGIGRTKVTDFNWRSVNNPSYMLEFKTDGTVTEYDNLMTYTGTWELTYPRLSLMLEDKKYVYSITSISKKKLELAPAGSTEKLSFTAIAL